VHASFKFIGFKILVDNLADKIIFLVRCHSIFQFSVCVVNKIRKNRMIIKRRVLFLGSRLSQVLAYLVNKNIRTAQKFLETE
jgi:hypothetical protein